MDPSLFTEFLTLDLMGKPAWMWVSFISLVFVLLALDLGLFNRGSREISIQRSFSLSLFYIFISLMYCAWIWTQIGEVSAMEFLTAYVIEKSLSMDNLFVMAVIFSALKIPRKYQHRVLFWGILGVIIMRGIMIGAGAALVHEFEWVLYIFAAFLVFTGIKLLFWEDDEDNEEAVRDSKIMKFLRKHFRVTDKLHGEKFLVRQKGKLCITPLLLALLMIELADVIFAVDSVPAVFAITQDTFIVYTSNIFAILGLRALFFSLSAMLERFEYLKYAISIVLIFIGAKVFAPLVLPIDKVPASISLSVTLAVLAAGIVFSLYKTRKQ